MERESSLGSLKREFSLHAKKRVGMRSTQRVRDLDIEREREKERENERQIEKADHIGNYVLIVYRHGGREEKSQREKGKKSRK